MWRRWGDAFYALLVLAVFTVQAAGLGALTWAFLLRRSGLGPGAIGLREVLVGTVAVTALALMVVTVYTLGYQARTHRRDAIRGAAVRRWTKAWTDVVFRNAQPPTGPLQPEALDSLLELREILTGSDAERIESLLRDYEIDRVLIGRAAKQGRGWMRRQRPGGKPRIFGGPRRLANRLEALDALARASMPEAFEPLLTLGDDPEPVLRAMVVRALAKSASTMPPGEACEEAAIRFVDILCRADVPPGAVEEALLLLDDSAPAVLELLLRRLETEEGGRSPVFPIALDAIGRLRLSRFGDEVATCLVHPWAEVRAAAFRALGLIGYLPEHALSYAMKGLSDPDDRVRIQAARSAYLLPTDLAIPGLWQLLGDRSWWVRRAGAWALVRLGSEGISTLRRASGSHPDRYGRHISAYVLLEGGHIDHERAHHLRRAAG